MPAMTECQPYIYQQTYRYRRQASSHRMALWLTGSISTLAGLEQRNRQRRRDAFECRAFRLEQRGDEERVVEQLDSAQVAG